ncbi:helix-turn-helix domain-containing protein [Candidatus Woesearchaeota archaeon]|jgi:DNA-binding transcriptional regulator YhcF (GntR family)|nr:helix-turn-helix domain-containing protein [Candidatus Woesearchaeota archaeon]MBT4248176.1 helix-turn-helix domain-containing protein [Candidatus Woesearchaeota archaeon]
MIDQKLLEAVFDEKVVHVIHGLLNQDTDFFSIRELADKADVTVSTTFRIVRSLETVGFVKKVARGRIKFFQIQRASDAYKQFAELLGHKQTVSEVIETYLQDTYGYQDLEILVPKKDKNKVFIITNEDIDDAQLAKTLYKLLNKKIKAMSITPKQFEKMKQMGLV